MAKLNLTCTDIAYLVGAFKVMVGSMCFKIKKQIKYNKGFVFLGIKNLFRWLKSFEIKS